MATVTEFLAQADHYIDEESRSILEVLTDDQFAAVVAATDEYCGGSDSEPGIDSTLVRTHETIGDFDASRAQHWNERGIRKVLEIGVDAVKFERVQMIKGQPRHDFIVVDFGEYRVVIK
jgi:hypothetical protein